MDDVDGVQWWVRCNECGNEMDAELADTRCEQCDALDWSEPYPEGGEYD